MAKTYRLTLSRRIVNRMTRAMARRGKGPAHELTMTGRRSGKRLSVMVTPTHIDDVTYLVAPYGEVGWVHNVRANPNVALSRGSVTTRYRATQIHGEEAGQVLNRYYVENKKHVGRYVEIPGERTTSDYIAAAERYPVFRLDRH